MRHYFIDKKLNTVTDIKPSREKTCHIIGAGDFNGELTVDDIYDEDLVISADGGLKHAEKAGIISNYIIGDFDSLGYIPKENGCCSKIITFEVKKDDTDMMLAIKQALKDGYKNIKIFGGLGGRIDHTLANIQGLCYICDNYGIGQLIGENVCIVAIKDSSVSFSDDFSGDISVFAVCGDAKNVCISGLNYEAEDITLSEKFPLGVSNHFCGKEVTVSVQSGMLLIVFNC